MPRKIISADELHSLLIAAFQERRVECVSECRIMPPLFRPGAADGSPNWYIAEPMRCPRYCHRIIEDVVARLAAEYDIAPPSPRRLEPAAS